VPFYPPFRISSLNHGDGEKFVQHFPNLTAVKETISAASYKKIISAGCRPTPPRLYRKTISPLWMDVPSFGTDMTPLFSETRVRSSPHFSARTMKTAAFSFCRRPIFSWHIPIQAGATVDIPKILRTFFRTS